MIFKVFKILISLEGNDVSRWLHYTMAVSSPEDLTLLLSWKGRLET